VGNLNQCGLKNEAKRRAHGLENQDVTQGSMTLSLLLLLLLF
jgi:hypothetical protein